MHHLLWQETYKLLKYKPKESSLFLSWYSLIENLCIVGQHTLIHLEMIIINRFEYVSKPLINPENNALSLMLFLVHISSGIWNQMVRPGWNKKEHIYFNANYTFKYRHKNASGTNTVLHMMLRITCQPKANINVVVLGKAMKEPWKPTCLKCSGLVLYFNF